MLTSFTYGPGEFVFPLDCIGETGQFVGTLWFKDHYVYSSGSRGTHDNWEAWWDPERIVSLTTGQTWVFTAGFNNYGVWWLDESGNTAEPNGGMSAAQSIPADLPAGAPLDVYATDRRYWVSLQYRGTTTP